MPNPPEARDDDGVLHWRQEVDRPRVIVETRGGRTEVDLGDVRPDVVVQDADGKLLVEVRVSHPVEADKAARVRERGLRMMEIDLSDCPPTLLLDTGALSQWVRQEAPRHWIWEPGAAREWVINKDALDAELAHRAAKVERLRPDAPSGGPMDWDAFRRLFEEREILPINRPPSLTTHYWAHGFGQRRKALRKSLPG